MEPTKITEGAILVAHIADTHLRDTQYGRPGRGLDFFEAAKDAVTSACAEADVVVLVGDIFDRPRPSPKVIGQLIQLDAIVKKAGKKMLAVTGNHDWCSPTWLATLFPVDRSSGIIALDGKTVDIDGFTFTGILPHTGNAFRNHVVEIEKQARGADVVLYHGFVDGVVPFFAGLKDPLHVDEFPIAKDNKAWLLGDIHMQGHMLKSRPGGGDCHVGYPGSTEMCSSSELKQKSTPLLRVTKTDAEIVKYIPVKTRPFVGGVIHTEDDLDKLIAKVEKIHDEHPLVVIKFNRELTATVLRLHAVLDAQRAVVRCYPLPLEKEEYKRSESDAADQLTIEHFISKRFEDSEELETVALGLFHRGTDDANSVVSDFVEKRLANTGLREDE